MDIQRFYQYTQKGAIPKERDIEALALLIKEYPYFQGAAFSYLKTLYTYDKDNFDEELKRLSVGIKDRRALFYYIFSEEYDRFFTESGKKDIDADKTSILLNAFFESREETYSDVEFEYNISLSGLATSDYLTYMQTTPILDNTLKLDQQENIDQDAVSLNLKHQNIIDTFINKSEEDGGIRIQMDKSDYIISENITENEEENEEELTEDVFFTETLAKIYIKQKKYEKAYKIIKHLSLNYPKKNIYFADQLSFLEKLIINSKYKDKK